MNENSYKTPVSNRGVENTEKGKKSPKVSQKSQKSLDDKIKMCVDWCQVTIFNYDKDVFSLFKEFFNIDSSLVFSDLNALYSYDKCYSYKDIKVLVSFTRDDMGVHIQLSGTACRQVEELNIDFIDLFKKIRKYNAQYTRLDIAIDNFSDKYFTMYRVKQSINKNLVVSRFKHTIEFIKTELKTNANKGYTIWFGSRASDIQIVFYDKLKERESQNRIVSENIKHWCRLEIRFRNKYASQVVLNLLENDFNLYIKSILKNYIKFVVPDSNEKNRSRIPLVSWWSDFIDDVDAIRLYNSNYVASITKKKDWLENSTARTNAMVLLSSIEDLSLDEISCKYLVDYFNKGIMNIDNKDLNYINEYRIKKGYNPIVLEDFKYMIGDIKDFLLERK